LGAGIAIDLSMVDFESPTLLGVRDDCQAENDCFSQFQSLFCAFTLNCEFSDCSAILNQTWFGQFRQRIPSTAFVRQGLDPIPATIKAELGQVVLDGDTPRQPFFAQRCS
jgi:hypothetical protein